PVSAWSGVIIDARGSGAQPALAPAIRSLEGQVLDEHPSVAYSHTMEGAKDLAGSHPLIIKAKRSSGVTHADLLLAPADLNKLKEIMAKESLSLIIAI
ncbi:MAG: hypothetical protein HY692_01640, partial [Cyanobacteria bacterium NC_groundwater_1444_Ag_S-0.65um_54_12]|nr:hypothetical protein [Cyanobacteria bacterium NC_groundwater_1444_Ag_S-0.65um_54_12]